MKRNVTIDLLRTIACLLVLNFHFEMLYPKKLSFLSFGGDLGNNIFFILSGYILYRKINLYKIDDFRKFIMPRLKKIMPSTLLILFLSIVTKVVVFYDAKTLLNFLIYPGHFWFVVYLVYFYIILFFQTKLLNKKQSLLLCILLLIIHFIVDNVHIERFAIGYISMLVGYYLNESNTKFKYMHLFVSFICYLIFKLLLMKSIFNHNVIHLLVGISTIMFSLILISITINNKKIEKVISIKPIKVLINAIAPCTLEIYLISFFKDWYIIRQFKNLFPFPISYVLCGAFIIVLSNLLYIINNRLWFKK